MKNTIKYLKLKEWLLGNGQCPECYACKPGNKWWTEYVGHENNCIIAKMLEEANQKVVYKKLNKNKTRKEFIKRGKSLLDSFKVVKLEVEFDEKISS